MNSLPKEVINIILEYAGLIKYRNGKYMNQIQRDDTRYHIFTTIPKFKPGFIPYGFCNDVKLSNGKLMYWGITWGPYEKFIQHLYYNVKNNHEVRDTNY